MCVCVCVFVCARAHVLEPRPIINSAFRGHYFKMPSLQLNLLPLLLVVDVQCQTAPYISFMDQTLADHSYVDISLVGNDGSGSDSVQCHTDLNSCCRSFQGSHRGDWYFPNGARLNFSPDNTDIYEHCDAYRVDLRHRNNANGPTGIYRCDIETEAVHDNDMRETVYVGLYTSDSGMLSVL